MRTFINTAFKHPCLLSLDPLVLPNDLFWQTYFHQPKTTLLVHTGYRNTPVERQLTIDGSIYIDSCEFETPPIWDKNPDSDLEQFYNKHQFGRYERVMLYGTRGNMAACRLALLLLYMGVSNIKVLDGGISACPNHDSLDASCQTKVLNESIAGMKTHKQLFMTAKQAYHYTTKGDCQLVDIRSKPQHEGLISGYPDYHKKGRPKGSLHGGNIDMFVNQYGRKGNFDRVINLWDANKIDWRNKHLILFCGTGWRAAEALIYGLDYGLTNLSVFSGIRDWIESSLPLEPR